MSKQEKTVIIKLMSNTIDISHVKFVSSVIPTDADIKLWESLSAEEQKAVIMRDLDAAEASGVAKPTSMAELISEARAELRNGN